MLSIGRKFFVLTIAVLAFALVAQAKVPSWLTAAASTGNQSYDSDIPGVILLDEQIVKVDDNGKIVTEERWAVRILNRSGRGLAVARAFYLTSAGKVDDFEAWKISKRSGVTEYGKKQIIDVIADDQDVYNEQRVKVIDASDDAFVGDVFGFTVTTENPPLFYQDIWQFQGRLPVVKSRYTIEVPKGWTASNIMFNHEQVDPVVNGNVYRWELNNLPFIKIEPMSPGVVNLAPYMAVNFAPSDKDSTGRSFDNWKEVSQWASRLYDPQVVINDEVAAKARELTEGLDSEIEKIKAIGKYVQNMQYIAIDIGVAYGNGYKPRASSTVLNRGYGDCKDKATLMRAMLQSLKIESYPVAIYSGDPSYVRKEWASPRQFNHCIIAVRVKPETDGATIVEDATLGRLLFFDATDDMTPVGDLPSYLQGSYGLVMAGDNGDLVQMPMIGAKNDLMSRTINVSLDGTGAIKGTINESTKGQSSRLERSLFRRLNATDYKKSIERWLTSGITAAKLENMKPTDRHEDAEFELDVEFSAPSYAQVMQGRLMVFKPTVVSRSNSVYLTDPERLSPVSMYSRAFEENVVFELPEGFAVDEMPEAKSIETDFGSYQTSYEVKEGKLHFSRKMETKRMLIPAANYSKVREFYKQIMNAENAPVVLIRQ